MNNSDEENKKDSSPYYSMENDYLMKTMKENTSQQQQNLHGFSN